MNATETTNREIARDTQPNQHLKLTRREILQRANYQRLLDSVSDRIGPVYVKTGATVGFRCRITGYSADLPQMKPGPGYNEFNSLCERIHAIDRAAIERIGCFAFCSVSREGCAYLVEFENGASLFLQSESDVESFADSCGLDSEHIESAWYAPDYWLDVAE